MCNRAYLDFYAESKKSASSITAFTQKDVIILGKTKLSMFLSRKNPTKTVNYQTSWNPRGNCYQGPGGSSSGSVAATAAYEWIDIGIGTDSESLIALVLVKFCCQVTYISQFVANGSIRRPAQCNGVFGLRPSRGALSNEGMFTIFK
jgi:Asp-tRNA(Asn)/Glu-tRNA(Gln) amidotransferase A subunit family amidase